jgi:hypothetical protein
MFSKAKYVEKVMSDKLVIEFIGNIDIDSVAVMASRGGDNPASAALTIADFLGQLNKAK